MGTEPTRRRFLAVTAVAAGLPLLAGGRALAGASAPYRWEGVALGADASLQIAHPDPAEARRLVRLCLAEVARLEGVFSLHQAGSALARLNLEGRLDNPPLDLVRLLGEAADMAAASGGAFDPTVQPLWQLFAGHFARPGADPAGPPAAAVEAVRRLVGHGDVEVSPRRVAFARRGMALTLNGIAQGYVTDRVADLLRQEGMADVLVDMGEARALGLRPGGRPWQVGLRAPGGDGTGRVLGLSGAAVATSAAAGTCFDAGGTFGHLLDPATGRPGARWRQVTVVAPTATRADALSTALSLLDEPRARALLAREAGVTAYLAGPGGGELVLGPGRA